MNLTLAEIAFWAAVACCAVAQVAIVRSALARRAPLAESAPMPPLHRPAEVAFTLVPAALLALVLALTWRATHRPVTTSVIIEAPATAAPEGTR